ncbi:MAG: ABC transporter ATP-binding protein [Thermodesulfobacteriota bacterium]
MREENIISVKDLSKKFRRYTSVAEGLKEVFHPLRKKYHKEFWALQGISFDVKRGETIGLIGPNGSGKSTLLQVLCGILRPTQGELSAHGRISALLELGAGFHPKFTGRENVFLNGAIMGLSKNEVEAKFGVIEEFADIGDFMDQPVRTYSSGMYLRLAFAAAINVDPDILIIDEALAVGDAAFQAKCYRQLTELTNKGTTIILVTHDLHAAVRQTERAILLHEGRIVDSGPSGKMVESYHRVVFGTYDGALVENPETEETGAFSADDPASSRANYNKNESRFGNSKACIRDFEVTDETGKNLNHVFSGDAVKIKIMVDIYADIECPGYGIEIKNKEGLLIYHINTWFNNQKFEALKKGSTVTVTFQQRAYLVKGEYFIGIGISSHSGKLEILDARKDLFILNVSNNSNCIGIADLNTSISAYAEPKGA